ncbi:type II secretion system protein GspF [Sphingomonas gilva]|uniref:General secretion pathway protein F n=1 Tax=Sphingomonas gilva TaxID=2305907 RepID=A0A396RLC6_9SPHN|nr:type II secretion system inner membrane protein GspF [Sphingomonas gilva]RHW16959.1 type II secretion system protein GspF [Sphingomonas gilva]
MAEFDYLAIDRAGRERTGRVSADGLDRARGILEARRLYVLRLAQGAASPSGPSLAGRMRFRRERLSGKQLSLFTRQLATLVAVSPLEEALRTIARQTEKPAAQGVIGRVHLGVTEGRRLAEAMRREEPSFPPLYRAMVSAGEASGTLGLALERLAGLLERQAEIRGKVLSALAYPIVLSFVAVAVVVALMTFVVPKVVQQFEDVGQSLPLLTRIVMGISDALVNWWWAILVGIAALGFLVWRALQAPAARLAFDRWLLRVPGLGRLIRDLHAARMARTLSTMVESRLPLVEGLALTVPTIHNRALRAATAETVEAIRGGGNLSAAFRRSGLFPPLLVYMIASGEAAGQLDRMLERAADYLEREFDTFTATAMSMLEPGIIVLMGGIVATIVLSILLPILQLQNLAEF